MEAIRNHRHGILLVVILLAFAAQSFGHTVVGGPIATDILTTVLVVVVLLAVFKRGTERVASLVAAAVAVAATLTHYIDLPEAWRTGIAVAQHSSYIAFTGFAVILILRRIFQQTQIRTDDVLGALCGYLLAGAAWAWRAPHGRTSTWSVTCSRPNRSAWRPSFPIRWPPGTAATRCSICSAWAV